MSPMELHERVFKKFLKDRPAKELIDKVELFWNFHLEHLYQPAVDILRRAQKEGQTVLILSNSPDFLVGPIAKKLGIEMWQATKYEIDEKGNFCNILKVMDGLEKARFTLDLAKRLNIFKKNITVYTDSIWDLPLLNVAGTKVAVNPDRKLLTLSKKENWSVI